MTRSSTALLLSSTTPPPSNRALSSYVKEVEQLPVITEESVEELANKLKAERRSKLKQIQQLVDKICPVELTEDCKKYITQLSKELIMD